MAELLERGDLAVFFRPTVETEDPDGLDDVQQCYLVLAPRLGGRHRRLVIGRKRLPDVDEQSPPWAFVDRVADDPETLTDDLGAFTYETKTRGTRHQPAARPAGEGVYGIVRRDDDEVVLGYRLELPTDPGPVQETLNIAPVARYHLQVRNPETPAPRRAGLPEGQRPDLPDELQQHFGGRRWAPAEVGFLDREGTELLLIGAAEEAGEAGDAIEREDNDLEGADLVERLGLDLDAHPLAPLTEGEWD